MKHAAHIIVAFIVLFWVAGCGGEAATATPAPTNTPQPTDTPPLTDTPKPTDTPTPTDTPEPTNTPTPAPTNTLTPEPTELPAEEPPSPDVQSVEVLQSLSYFDDRLGWAHIIGLLANNSEQPLRSLRVLASLLDAEGKFFNSASTVALINLTLPGEAVPFHFMLSDAPELADYELVAKFDAADDDDVTETCREFGIKDATGRADAQGYNISGLVENRCDTRVDFVRVVGSVFDAKGQLIGVGMTIAKLDVLAPGQSSPFELILTDVSAEEATRFALLAEADVTEQPAAEEETGQAVEILQSSTYTGGLDIQHIIGVVRNNTDRPFKFVEIVASTFDEEGKFVDSGTTFAMVQVFLPDEVVPFELSFFDAPAFASYELAVEFDEADSDDLKETCREFEISGAAGSADFIGYEIIGQVTSGCADTVKFVEIIGAVYDAEGRLIGVDLGFSELDELAPGATSPFALTLIGVEAGEVATFELVVEGTVKD
jgi:hypothetical protein